MSYDFRSLSNGVLAQLVERLNGIEEVRGSNPLGSRLPRRPDSGKLRLAGQTQPRPHINVLRLLTFFRFHCYSGPGILGPLSAPPLPPPLPTPPAPPSPRTGRVATCLGCAVALAIGIVVAVILLVIAEQKITNAAHSTESHNSVIGSIYVGDWQDVKNPGSVIQILPNGSASCRIVNGMTNYNITGGQATFDKQTKRLAIKLFLFGPSWHVDEPPHETADGLVMKLDGQTFRKFQSNPSPSGTQAPGVAI